MPDIPYSPNDLEERCGLILKDGTIVEIRNVHAEPEKGFKMAPTEFFRYIKSKKVTGTWHTHPQSDPNLSQEDYAGFLQWPDFDHYIRGERDGEPLTLKFRVDNGVVIGVEN